MLYCVKCNTVSKSSVCAQCIQAQFEQHSPEIGKLELLHTLPERNNRNTRVCLQSQGERYVAELFDAPDNKLGEALMAMKNIRNLETAVMAAELAIDGKRKHAVLYRDIATSAVDNAHPVQLLKACAQLFKVVAKLETLGYSHHGLSPSDIHFTSHGAVLGSSTLFAPIGSKFSTPVNDRYYPLEKHRTNTVSTGDDTFALTLSMVELLNGAPLLLEHGRAVMSGDFRHHILEQMNPKIAAHTPVFATLRYGVSGAPAAEIASRFRAMCRNSVWSDVRIERKLNDREYEGFDLIGGRNVVVQLFQSERDLELVRKTSRMLSHALPCVYRSYAAAHSDAALVIERVEGSAASDVLLDTALLDALHLKYEKMDAKLVDGQLRFSRIVMRM